MIWLAIIAVVEAVVYQSRYRSAVVGGPFAAAWVKATKGFGIGNLAYVIAATGNLDKYDTVSKVWKRLGLAVIEGDRQGSPKSKSAEDYIRHGYNKHRRCVAYLLQSSLVKGSDHYRGICNARKEYERTRIEKPMHVRNRAERFMVKRAIADLWGAWKESA